jgi:hypothetical protein
MKTRLISTTMVILFAALTIAGATNNRTDYSSVASSHEYTTEQNLTDLNSCYPSAESTMMEEWIDGRNQWEQIGQGSTANDLSVDFEMLEEWMVSRNVWEQQNMNVENPLGIPSVLEQWTASAENWEQR